MTYNKIGRNFYWFWAIYISFIPLALTFTPLILLLKYLNVIFNRDVLLLSVWILSYALSAILIKIPYDKMLDKYKWEYMNGTLRNPFKNISVPDSNITRVFVGFKEEKKKKLPLFLKLFNPAVYSIAEIGKATHLTLRLKNGRILFLQMLGLENGSALQTELLKTNQEKLADGPFDFPDFKKRNKKIKWYVIMNENFN